MPRKEKPRIIEFPIRKLTFRPENPKGEIILESDEVEAVRLIGLEKRKQKDAAIIMGVSQPTFSRIFSKALEKIADAFINEKTIKFELKPEPLTKIYLCRKCKSIWVCPIKLETNACPFCGNRELKVVTYENIGNIYGKGPR